jgi:hypothetical protein
MSRKRIVNLFLVLALMVLSAAGSWIAGSRIVSPAEAAARTAPPTPSPILIAVEKRVLTSNIVTRGAARYGLPQSVSIVPSSLKPGVGIITTLPLRNTQINEGDLLLTASGRPVFVLQGEVPTYRDLIPGNSGKDVLQLENALKRLGFDPGPIDGTYDEQTSVAVSQWYDKSGWEPFGATSAQLANLRTLEQEYALAQNNKLTADDAVASARLAVQAAKLNAESANLAAQTEVDAKTRLRDRAAGDPNLTAEERAVASAGLTVALAQQAATQAAGEASVQSVLDAQKAAERQARVSANLAARSEADLEQARRKVGVQIPSDEIIYIHAFPVRVEQVNAVVGGAAGGPVLALTNNRLAIDSSLPLEEAPFVKPGMVVAIDEPDLGVKAMGVVARVAETPGTFGADSYHIYFETSVQTTSVPIEGFSLRLTIPVKSTGGEVLTAPTSALSLAADGTSRVQVDNDGMLSTVVVEPGLSANGFVEIKPIDGVLQAGQMVVVGYEKPQ